MVAKIVHRVSNTGHGALTACNLSASTAADWSDVAFGKLPAGLTTDSGRATCEACRAVIDVRCDQCHAAPGTRCSYGLAPAAPHRRRLELAGLLASSAEGQLTPTEIRDGEDRSVAH